MDKNWVNINQLIHQEPSVNIKNKGWDPVQILLLFRKLIQQKTTDFFYLLTNKKNKLDDTLYYLSVKINEFRLIEKNPLHKRISIYNFEKNQLKVNDRISSKEGLLEFANKVKKIFRSAASKKTAIYEPKVMPGRGPQCKE